MNHDYPGFLEVWGLVVDPDPLIEFGFIIVSLIGGGVTVAGLRWVKFRRVPCPHRVPGGITSSKCPKCLEYQRQQEALAARQEALAAQRARNRERDRIQQEVQRARIRERAQKLRDEEFQRLADQIRRDYKRLLEITPRDFEILVSSLFRKMGYFVQQTPFTNDRGRDAIARSRGKTYLIECKAYAKDKTVGRPALQKLHSAMTEEAAAGGFCVTTGKFANTAEEFAQGKNIELVDGQGLVELMRRYMPYDTEQADVFKEMCEDCGGIVERRLSRPMEIVRCAHGHEVRSDWAHEKFGLNG